MLTTGKYEFEWSFGLTFARERLAGAGDVKSARARAPMTGWMKISRLVVTDDFDKMAAVVDWLDACRSRDLNALLDFYADNASLDCACEGAGISGRSALAAYWRPKLSGASRDAFGLEEITPLGDGVALDYLGFDGKRIRIVFSFDAQGRISHMNCRPVPR
jgi:hypothetical protein